MMLVQSTMMFRFFGKYSTVSVEGKIFWRLEHFLEVIDAKGTGANVAMLAYSER